MKWLSQRLRAVQVSAVLIAVVSVIAAGFMGQLADSRLDEIERSGTINQRVALTDHQWLRVTAISAGSALVDQSRRELAVSSGIFVGVTVQAATGESRRAAFARCKLDIGKSDALSTVVTSSVKLPDPGFMSTSMQVWEVHPDDLEGAVMVCEESGFLTYRPVSVRIDLGLRGEALQLLIDRAQTRELLQADDRIEVTGE